MMPRSATPAGLLLLLLTVLLVVLPQTPFLHAKEIEATHEWTLLGENDTIAAGMHVRMDLEKGERWVKLPDVETADSTSKSVMITEDGSIVDDKDQKSSDEQQQREYDMMYSALSRLPDEEKQRIAFDDISATDHERLREMWTNRQEQLRDLDVLDLPQILKESITSIKQFLEHPVAHLVEFGKDGNEGSTNEEEEEEEGILQTLLNLEYHLQDIDMTRDFHTLGGWPVLSSLLSDSVLQRAVANDQTKGTSLDLNDAVDFFHRVQSTAAWAMGTAVKNTAEFQPYVLERKPEDGASSPLDLVVQQLSTDPSPTEKQIKLVYCLGSFLRGNAAAQEYFRKTVSPRVLPKLLRDSLSSSPKLHSKVLRLVTDLRQEDDDTSGAATTFLCEIIGGPKSFEMADNDTFLEAISTFAGSCDDSWDSSAIKDRLSGMLDDVEQMDPDLQEERRSRILSGLQKLEPSVS